ncbi:SDR family NAD(P)-dependent oxidoreductase [Nocardioides anomalus]|uniref:SDR family NAD(P)-dependent oxidoreductase n=1 Tax=Nocardioides anomalus TaxID=2712223 RepID=A0A6G6WJT4_9ACTN|nr:oxidoreductase [Nocardioides anomalus]QIG45417.1 SDR family NAD(P)-dependent oxidoreductase [Nocardioides anomalus]
MTDVWGLADIPDQAGRTVVVTGTSVGGIGHATALELARRGARVVLAGRSPAKLAETRAAVTAEVPTAALEGLEVDLASLASVRAAAADAQDLGPLDVLVNNAGVMGTSRRSTEDGFDLQLATNHLGPFLLTGLLLPQLLASKAGRVVTVSSLLHKTARRAPTSFAPTRGVYRKWQVYGQSKLANLLFTHELERRAREKELPVQALAAHPGFSGTHLAANGQYGRSSGGLASILDATIKAVSQPAAHGAWPVLMAATAELPGATYVGPGGLGEVAGAPQVVTSSALSRDPDAARRLWALSEEATGISYP